MMIQRIKSRIRLTKMSIIKMTPLLLNDRQRLS